MIVRAIMLMVEAYVAYFVVLHNFRFYLRKKYEKRLNLSLENSDVHFDGEERNRKCCSTFRLIETMKERIIVCFIVSAHSSVLTTLFILVVRQLLRDY
jgi:hypothetical protein